MNQVSRFFQKGRFVLPVRLYHALSTILTLGACCLLSSLVVFLLDGALAAPMSLSAALVLCSTLTLLMGGAALAWEAGRYIRPARDVADAAAKVAKGDFDGRNIERFLLFFVHAFWLMGVAGPMGYGASISVPMQSKLRS